MAQIAASLTPRRYLASTRTEQRGAFVEAPYYELSYEEGYAAGYIAGLIAADAPDSTPTPVPVPVVFGDPTYTDHVALARMRVCQQFRSS